MSGTSIAWLSLVAVGLLSVGFDLFMTLRRGRSSLRASAIASIGWLLVGFAFTAVIRLAVGSAAAGDYVTVFLLEKSLSLDNVAVFAVVLGAFAIPQARQQRVLVGGILAALVLRLAFVAGGLALVNAIHGVLVAFGAVLVVAGIRMVRTHEGDESKETPKVVQWLQRRRVKPALAALLTLAVTDLVFAVDSVPAAFAVTRDALPVAAANVFAVLGLRPLYDLLATAMDRLSHLERSLGVLLALIGLALCVEPIWKVPEWIVLAGVVVTLGTGVLLSLIPARRVLVTAGGGALLVAGAAMLVLPGPGLLVVAAGLGLLATEYVWARRTLDRVKERIPRRGGRGRASTSPDEPEPPAPRAPSTSSAP